jgi:hypothetical protein
LQFVICSSYGDSIRGNQPGAVARPDQGFREQNYKVVRCLTHEAAGSNDRETIVAGWHFGWRQLPSSVSGSSRAEFIAKLGVVAEEADETIYWLELSPTMVLSHRRRLTELLKEAHELTAIFTAAQATSKTR